MRKLWNALKWLVAAASALVALFYIQRSRKHEANQEKLVQKAKQLEKDTEASLQKSLAAQKRARAANQRASAAYNEAEAKIHEIEERDKSLAERLRAYRDRRSNRLRERGNGS